MKWFSLTLILFAIGNSYSKPEYQHGYAFLSQLKYPQDFEHFSYVNPKAPKGGTFRIPEMGAWDSFNPIPLRGRVLSGLDIWSPWITFFMTLY